MSTPLVVQPDLERFVWSAIQDRGVTSFTFALTHDWPWWHVRYGIQVDCRAGSKSAARQKAENVRRQICALADAPWDEGVITYVQPTEGPWWLPDDDGCPRYTARYEIRCHPRREIAEPESSRPELRGTPQ
jgi:hypothetical protein